MREYEVMFILKPAADDDIQRGVEKARSCIVENAGIVNKVDLWGKKRLAYDIQGMNEGFYVLITFVASAKKTVAELDRKLRIDEDCIRHMIISKG